ncbi:MAG TPA: [NiFe]-hydrogenase assembly chaperone HybE [Ramlibacter sp.]|uniref:[NiFe]-hydrogenase assembly chaperone HybE n=1 Tax=Ramlibacter sp. TaxID=1917967 RepID=UPI002D8033C3|nr:[NiFe]-hydrogenase assembly chaperone HybE [Ramlibacter sp.]HET8746364.1 [NiFe]-hydrogenase assembly chaperone HybE [Ramlibacter sp.]
MRPAADPTRDVEEVFGRIWRERMAGLPILNPALAVEAVGLQRWNGHWLGLLVTPWAMSVLLLPDEPAAWVSVPPQQRRFVHFPFGALAFLGGEEPGLGEYQTCSLFSPMDAFADRAQARATAQASLAALLAPAPAEPKQPPERAAAPPQGAVPSRRRFLGLGA